MSFTYKTIKGAFAGLFDLIYSGFDELTSAFKMINTDHYYIHSGIGYCLSNDTVSLAFGEKEIYRFVAPLTKYAHIKNIQVSCEGATVKVTLKRGVTITSNGTIITDAINNLNDNVETESEAKLYNGSAAYTGGSKWFSMVVHGSTSVLNKGSESFVQSDSQEYVTKNENEEYILEIENIDEDSDTAYNLSLSMFFYEEPRGYQS